MPATTVSTEDMIRARAHALWLEEGQPEGRAELHWFRALELVNSEAGAVPKAVAKPKRKAARKPA